jgi:hypothetical protein
MIIALATKSAHASAVFNDFMLELMEKNSRDYPERQATEKITGKYAFKVYDNRETT